MAHLDEFINKCVRKINQFNIEHSDIIAHVKGGANIQFQLDIHITTDVDVILFPQDDSIDALDIFIKFFIKNFDYNFMMSKNGSLTVLTDDPYSVDIVVGNSEYCLEEDDDENSMFKYAVNKLGYTIQAYKDFLFNKKKKRRASESEISEITLASLKLEYYQCEKGIENNKFYIDQREHWSQEASRLKGLLNSVVELDKPTVERRIQLYNRQSSNEYQHFLADKLERYEKKRDLLLPYKGGGIPNRYVAKLSRKDKKKQVSEILKSRRLYKKHKYYTRKKVNYPHVKSKHIRKAQKMYGIENVTPETLAGKTGCTVAALKEIVRKGEGAYYSSGSRPNQTPQSWGLARLASAVTGGKAGKVDYAILKKGCPKKWLKNLYSDL